MKYLFFASAYLFCFFNLMTAKEQIKQMFILLLIAILAIGIMNRLWIPNKKLEISHKEKISDIIKIPSTTWTMIDIFTWGVTTWDQSITIESAADPREHLNYLLKNGKAWEDYIVATPENQPPMNSPSWAINTKNMHNYISENRISFDIPDNQKNAYIMFVTTKPLSKVANLFVGIDGETVGRIDKKQKLETEAKNEYLYELCNLRLIWNNWYRFSAPGLCEEWPKGKIFINAVVGEANNKVEKIIIFFK